MQSFLLLPLLQVDLLIQMFQTWLNPQQQQQRENSSRTLTRKTSVPSKKMPTANTLNVESPVAPHNTLTRHHVGYAKEGRDDPYNCLADIALKLNELQNKPQETESTLSEKRRSGTFPRSKRDGIYFTLGDVFNNPTAEEKARFLEEDEAEGSSDGIDPSQSLPIDILQKAIPPRLSRKNALRASRPRSSSEPNIEDEVLQEQTEGVVVLRQKKRRETKPVLKLSKLLCVASYALTHTFLQTESRRSCYSHYLYIHKFYLIYNARSVYIIATMY